MQRARKNFPSKTGRMIFKIISRSLFPSSLSLFYYIFRSLSPVCLSLSQVFPLGLVSVGKSWTSLRNSIDKRDHRKLFHATLSANVLVPRRRFERGRADVRRHDAECVPKIRPHFGTAHRAR